MEVRFVLRMNKTNKVNLETIYCRVTVSGVRAGDFSTFVKVLPEDWHSKAQKIISSKPGTDQDNETLENIRVALKEIYNRLYRSDKAVTAQAIKSEYLNDSKPRITFLEVFFEMIERKREKSCQRHSKEQYL